MYSRVSPTAVTALVASGTRGMRMKTSRARTVSSRAAASRRLADFIPGSSDPIPYDEPEYEAGGEPADVGEVGYASAGSRNRAAPIEYLQEYPESEQERRRQVYQTNEEEYGNQGQD